MRSTILCTTGDPNPILEELDPILSVPHWFIDMFSGASNYVNQTLHHKIAFVGESMLFLRRMTYWHWKILPKKFNRKKKAMMHYLYQVYSPTTEMNASKISRYMKIQTWNWLRYLNKWLCNCIDNSESNYLHVVCFIVSNLFYTFETWNEIKSRIILGMKKKVLELLTL